MDDRIRRWDERYARLEGLSSVAPSPPLPEALPGLAPGLALDLACGAGRNSIFLAERGWRVQALDGSRPGLARMMEEARRRAVDGAIEPRLVDLEEPGFALPEAGWDLICDFYFLHRPLFEQIRRAVRPGGTFAAAIQVRSRPAERGRFLLEPGELPALVLSWGWEILLDREVAALSDQRHATAELIARCPRDDG